MLKWTFAQYTLYSCRLVRLMNIISIYQGRPGEDVCHIEGSTVQSVLKRNPPEV